MERTVERLSAATHALALVALAAAIWLEARLGRGAYGPLVELVLAAGAAGVTGGLLRRRHAVAAILLLACVVPALFALALGFYRQELLLVWSAALTGVLLTDLRRPSWAFPHCWRFPLVLWSLVIAVGWPLVVLREIDYAPLDLLERYRIPNTGIGGPPTLFAIWIMDVAIVHLLGLLWFNWLFRYAREDAGAAVPFERYVALPFALGAVAGSLLALYQGLVDIEFLSGGLWTTVARAPGSLMDANAFGMVAAMWTAGLLAFTPSRHRAAGAAGSAICWGGLWMTGSRTAMAAAAVAAGVAGLALLARPGNHGRRLRLAGAAAAVAALVIAALAFAPALAESPLARLRRTLPADASADSLRAFGLELWNRNGYGRAATALILEQPLVGHGMGTFNMFGSDYLHRAGAGVPPDNAQNWWRHHVAELGALGASGLLVWTVVFGVFLLRTRGDGHVRLPAAWLKGALVGLGLASLVGMPAQNLAVTMTFWTFAFWYTRDVEPGGEGDTTSMRPAAWATLCALVVAFAGTTVALGRGELRPAARAARGDWRYTYGMYTPPAAPADTHARWTEHRGAAVIPVEGEWLVLTIRAEHPDLEQRPVRATVMVNGRTIIDTRLHTSAPIVRAIEVGPAPRAVLDARVDRVWRPPGAPPDAPDAGLSLSWRFAAAPPETLPVVSAPGPRSPHSPDM